MMFDAAGVKNHSGFCTTIQTRRLNNFFSRNIGDFGSDFGRIFQSCFACNFPIICPIFDKFFVNQIFVYQDIQDSVGDCNISSGFELEMQIALPRRRCFTRVNDNPNAAVVALFPQKTVQDRESFRAIRARNNQNFGVRNIRPRIRGAVNAKRFIISGGG